MRISLEKYGNDQTLLFLDHATILFSYSTPVAARLIPGGYVCTNKYYSNTTSNHINKWLNGAKAEVVPQDVIDDLLVVGRIDK